MDFDPKEYLRRAKAEAANAPSDDGFDPKAYLAKARGGQTEEPKSSAAQTFLEKYGDMSTIGYLPQLQAATEKPMAWVMDKLTGQNVSEDMPDYVQRRDENIKRQTKLAEANPVPAALGTVAGFAGGPLALRGLGALAKLGSFAPKFMAAGEAAETLPALSGAAGEAAQTASVGKKIFDAKRIADAAKTGAAMGAVMNPGDTEGEMGLQLGDRAMNAAGGALFGVGADLAIAGGSGLVRAAGDKMREAAERRAFKALGPYARDAINANERGKINEIGRELLDSGVIGKGNKSYEQIGADAGAAKEKAGQVIGGIIDTLDNFANGLGANAGLDRAKMAKAVEEELLMPSGLPGADAHNAKVSALVDEFRGGGSNRIGLKEAQGLKQKLQKLINWKRAPDADIPLPEQVHRSLVNKTKKGLESAAEFVAGQKGDDTLEQYLAAKRRYGAMGTAEKIANRRESKEFANRLISPSDYMAGGIGALAGAMSGHDLESRATGAAAGLSLGAANRFGRAYGNQIMARNLERVGVALTKIPRFAALAQDNPKGFQMLVQSLAHKLEGSGGSLPVPQLAGADKPEQRQQDRGVAAEPLVEPDEARKRFVEGN